MPDIAPFHILDTKYGDRLLDGAAILALIDEAPPSDGAFDDLSAGGVVSGQGFIDFFASPPPLGATVPAAVTVDTLTLDIGTKTATAVAGAATLDKISGVITSEPLTTAAGATYLLTITNSKVAAGDLAFASVNLGAGTGGTPCVASVKATATQIEILIQNIHLTDAFNAAIVIDFFVIKN